MTWLRIDDLYYDHPKLRTAGPLAMAMDIAGMCYASRFLTDGFIAEAVISHLIGVPRGQQNKCLQSLIEAGRWEIADGGYIIHDFLEYNPSAEVTKANRKHEADRKVASRARQKGGADNSLRAEVLERDSYTCHYCHRTSDEGVIIGIDHVIPRSKGGPHTLNNLVACCNSCNSRKHVSPAPVQLDNQRSPAGHSPDNPRSPETPSPAPSPAPGDPSNMYIPSKETALKNGQEDADGIPGRDTETDYPNPRQAEVDAAASERASNRRRRRRPEVPEV